MSEDEQSATGDRQAKGGKLTVHIISSPGEDPLAPPRGKSLAIAMMVSREEREWIDEVRARSIQLAYARGHITRM